MKKIIITFVVLLAVLVIVFFISENIFKKPIVEKYVPQQQEEEETLPLMDVKEQYKDSTYTFVGSVDLPTPCHTLEAVVNPISDAMFEIKVTTIAPKADVMCAQVVTSKQYSVSFKGPEEVLVYADINGIIYELNRFVVPEGENINTYELFIKG